MDQFSASTAVTLSVPLQDKSGNQLAVTAITYRVTDQNGAEIVPATGLAGFVAGDPSAAIVVPAEANTLAPDTLLATRQVTLLCTTGANTTVLHAGYALAAPEPLKSGFNSFMSYAQAQFVAMTMTGTEGWEGADEQARIAALVEARTRILRLNFTALDNLRDMSLLSYRPDGTRDVRYPGVTYLGGNLGLLTPDQFNALPVDFIVALRQAQLAEANAILAGDTIDQKRRDGMVQDNVGESRQLYRPGKPLELPVSRRALGYLSGFVSFALRIGRA